MTPWARVRLRWTARRRRTVAVELRARAEIDQGPTVALAPGRDGESSWPEPNDTRVPQRTGHRLGVGRRAPRRLAPEEKPRQIPAGSPDVLRGK